MPTVINVLPNQIAGKFFPILETTNPETTQNVEDTRVYESVLNIKGEHTRNTSARKIGTLLLHQ